LEIVITRQHSELVPQSMNGKTTTSYVKKLFSLYTV